MNIIELQTKLESIGVKNIFKYGLDPEISGFVTKS